MNALDGVILVMAAWTAWAGFRLGFAHRVLSWAGFLIGLWLGSLIVGRWFETDNAATTAAQFLQILGVLLVAATLGQTLGALVGRQVRTMAAAGGLGPLDAAGGVVVGLVGIALSVWVIAPAMVEVPGWPAKQSRNSVVARAIVEVLGEPPSALGRLSEAVGIRGVPEVFDSLRGAPADVPAPPNSPVTESVWRQASTSVLRITGQACGRVISGSGWVVGPDLVVTNAHVVAGTESIEVESLDGERRSGRVVGFDSRNDLAVLRVRGLQGVPLEIDPASKGDVGVVLGFPGGGRLAVQPYIVGESLDARGEDIYGEGGVLRRIIVVGSRISPGDSGGPLIDIDGDVAGVIFAVAPDREEVAYAVRTSELVGLLRGELQDSVDVGRCL